MSAKKEDAKRQEKSAEDNAGLVKGDQASIVRAEATEDMDTTSAAVSGYRAAKDEAEKNPNVGVQIGADVDTSAVDGSKNAEVPVGKTEFGPGEQPPGHELQADQEMRRNIAPETELEEMGRDFDARVRGYKQSVRDGNAKADAAKLDSDRVEELAKRAIEH